MRWGTRGRWVGCLELTSIVAAVQPPCCKQLRASLPAGRPLPAPCAPAPRPLLPPLPLHPPPLLLLPLRLLPQTPLLLLTKKAVCPSPPLSPLPQEALPLPQAALACRQHRRCLPPRRCPRYRRRCTAPGCTATPPCPPPCGTAAAACGSTAHRSTTPPPDRNSGPLQEGAGVGWVGRQAASQQGRHQRQQQRLMAKPLPAAAAAAANAGSRSCHIAAEPT